MLLAAQELPSWIVSLGFWGPLQLANFRAVPSVNQPLVVFVGNLFWNTYLSISSHSATYGTPLERVNAHLASDLAALRSACDRTDAELDLAKRQLVAARVTIGELRRKLADAGGDAAIACDADPFRPAAPRRHPLPFSPSSLPHGGSTPSHPRYGMLHEAYRSPRRSS